MDITTLCSAVSRCLPILLGARKPGKAIDHSLVESFQKEVCSVVRGFLNGGTIPIGFCDSVIVLIPKINNPQHLKNFRPISPCNVLYKIASKVLSN